MLKKKLFKYHIFAMNNIIKIYTFLINVLVIWRGIILKSRTRHSNSQGRLYPYEICMGHSDIWKVLSGFLIWRVKKFHNLDNDDGGLYASWQGRGCLEIFCRMARNGIELDAFVFQNTLKACAALEDWKIGGQVHGLIFKLGWETEVWLVLLL